MSSVSFTKYCNRENICRPNSASLRFPTTEIKRNRESVLQYVLMWHHTISDLSEEPQMHHIFSDGVVFFGKFY